MKIGPSETSETLFSPFDDEQLEAADTPRKVLLGSQIRTSQQYQDHAFHSPCP